MERHGRLISNEEFLSMRETASRTNPHWSLKGMTPEHFKAWADQAAKELAANLNRNVRRKSDLGR
jgi:hypothetical protein